MEVYKIWPLVVTLDVDCDISGSDNLTVPQRTGSVHQREWVDERVLIHLKHSLLETLSFSHKQFHVSSLQMVKQGCPNRFPKTET